MDSSIVLDLDGTLTVDDKAVAYPEKVANSPALAAASAAREQGFRLVVATSRNMKTFRGDVDMIRRHTQPIIEEWFRRREFFPDDLVVGKTWCGPRGFYVDDRNMHVEEFVFRFGGTYADSVVDLIFLPQADGETRLAAAHGRHRKLERLFNVGRYFYLTSDRQTVPAPPELRDDAHATLIATSADTDFAAAIQMVISRSTSDRLLIIETQRDLDPYLFFLVDSARLQQEAQAVDVIGYSPSRGAELLLAPRTAVADVIQRGGVGGSSLEGIAAGLGSHSTRWLVDPTGTDTPASIGSAAVSAA